MTIRTAMLLAAGLGTRMRPLTAALPKPLLPLGGRTLLDHAIDRLEAAGVERIVVNTHWQAPRMEAHLAARRGGPTVVVQHEPDLLDTGGAVRAALEAGHLGTAPFFVVNGDAFWLDGPRPALARLAASFDSGRYDALLLVHRTAHVQADVGFGDFAIDSEGRVRRRREREVAPYVFAGVQLVTPSLFETAPAGAFSMNRLWDRAIATARLTALVHDGLWFHLSTPADLTEAETRLHWGQTGESR